MSVFHEKAADALRPASILQRCEDVIANAILLSAWLQENDYFDNSGQYDTEIGNIPEGLSYSRQLRDACRRLADRADKLVCQRIESLADYDGGHGDL